MGKKRIIAIGAEETLKETDAGKNPTEKTKKTDKPPEKVHISGLKGGQRLKVVSDEPVEETAPSASPVKTAVKKPAAGKTKTRSQKYLSAKAKIEPGKFYSLKDGVALLVKTSYSQFPGKAEVHLKVRKANLSGEASLPYFETKTRKIEIASEKTLKKLEEGKIDFDVLLAAPSFMPNLLKYAKLLGPKGLMPNPKNGTIVQDPEKALEKFQKPVFSYKTEPGGTLIHSVFGQVSQKEEELEANLISLIKAIDPKNIDRCTIKATMGPAIKIKVD